MFATSHLESLDRAEERKQQIAEAMQVFSKDDDVVFCGDTNVNEAYDGEIVLPEGWKDAWTELRPSEPGFTFDIVRNTMMAKQDSGWAVANHALLRFDRFWVKLKHYTPIEIELIDDSVDGNLWPSDHFGLLLTLEERQHDSQAEVPQLASQFAPQLAKTAGHILQSATEPEGTSLVPPLSPVSLASEVAADRHLTLEESGSEEPEAAEEVDDGLDDTLPVVELSADEEVPDAVLDDASRILQVKCTGRDPGDEEVPPTPKFKQKTHQESAKAQPFRQGEGR
jgi:hypothetical protein